jgi:HEAT repeat protein
MGPKHAEGDNAPVSPREHRRRRLLAHPLVVASAGRILHFVAVRWPRVSRFVEAIWPPPVRVSPEPARPGALAQSTRSENLARLAGDPDYARRARAAAELADVVDPETTTALIAALRDPSAEVAVCAVGALARHRGQAAISALSGVVRNDDHYFSSETRAAAVRALGPLLSSNGGTGIASITGAVADTDVMVSVAAIEALAGRDEGASVEALLGVLENGTGFYLPLTRQNAARALGKLRARHAGDVEQRLHALLQGEADAVVREALVIAEGGHANPNRS